VAAEQARTLVWHIRRLAACGAARSSDRALMQRFTVERDELAFEALVRRHGPMVLGVCRRILREEHDAEDAFQATFLVLARKAAQLDRLESVGNWLYGVATRVSLRARSDAGRRRDRERRVKEQGRQDLLTDLTIREAQQILDEEMSRLPDKYRAALVLCCLEGLARDEAAQQLGCPAATLKSRLERAREILRKRLARRGFTLSSVLLASLLTERFGQAAVSSLLLKSIVKTASAFALGSLSDKLVSSTAIALAESALTSWSAWKLKLAFVVLVITLSSLGVRVATLGSVASDQPGSRASVVLPRDNGEAVDRAAVNPAAAPSARAVAPAAEGKKRHRKTRRRKRP
jgi:RNA polymerase sigma factor (sigma-70 family)